jgi:hypothetical protein
MLTPAGTLHGLTLASCGGCSEVKRPGLGVLAVHLNDKKLFPSILLIPVIFFLTNYTPANSLMASNVLMRLFLYLQVFSL